MEQPTINLVPGPVSDNISRSGQIADTLWAAPPEDNGRSDGVPPGLRPDRHGRSCRYGARGLQTPDSRKARSGTPKTGVPQRA